MSFWRKGIKTGNMTANEIKVSRMEFSILKDIKKTGFCFLLKCKHLDMYNSNFLNNYFEDI